MFTLSVWSDKEDRWVVQYLRAGHPVEWWHAKATCQEHAEAEAVARYPDAVTVNGIKV